MWGRVRKRVQLCLTESDATSGIPQDKGGPNVWEDVSLSLGRTETFPGLQVPFQAQTSEWSRLTSGRMGVVSCRLRWMAGHPGVYLMLHSSFCYARRRSQFSRS